MSDDQCEMPIAHWKQQTIAVARERDEARARVAELEAALESERQCVDYQTQQVNRWAAECKAAVARAEKAEAAAKNIAEKAQAYLDVVCDWIDASDERAALEQALAGEEKRDA